MQLRKLHRKIVSHVFNTDAFLSFFSTFSPVFPNINFQESHAPNNGLIISQSIAGLNITFIHNGITVPISISIQFNNSRANYITRLSAKQPVNKNTSTSPAATRFEVFTFSPYSPTRCAAMNPPIKPPMCPKLSIPD